MRFERIGAQGIKIILDSEETKLLYNRLSEKGPAGGRLLIAALLAAAQEECSITFSGDRYNVEILDSHSGAVIYITEIKPYYYLSPRRGLTMLKKRSKQLFCCFDSPEKLLRFIKAATCTCFNSPSSQLYSNGAELVISFENSIDASAETLLSEFDVTHRYSLHSLPEEYEIMIEHDAVPKLRELLYAVSPLPYHQKQTGSCRKQ